MDELIKLLEREAKLFNNVAAQRLVAAWKRDGRLIDAQIYEAHRIKHAAKDRAAQGKRRLAEKLAAKARKEKLDALAAKVERTRALRNKIEGS